jgi:hypothetical protein
MLVLSFRILPAIAAAGLLAACATPEVPPPAAEQSAPVVAEAPTPPAPSSPRKAKPEPRNDTLKHLANRKLKPIETRPLNVKASCSFRDPNGYRGNLRLDVKQASVKRFQASVQVPKQGACNFDLQHFEQTETTPNVVLAAKNGACRVSFWEQEHQVTVAFRDCKAECSGQSVDYLWPILVDNRKGLCS